LGQGVHLVGAAKKQGRLPETRPRRGQDGQAADGEPGSGHVLARFRDYEAENQDNQPQKQDFREKREGHWFASLPVITGVWARLMGLAVATYSVLAEKSLSSLSMDGSMTLSVMVGARPM